MMEKVKLTREQAEAIEWATHRDGRDYTHAELITEHSKKLSDWRGRVHALNDLSLLTLVDALRIGYEVEQLEYKPGDKITYVGGGEYHGVYTVAENQKYEPSVSVNENVGVHFGKANIRHSTLEEIKAEQECRLWAKIGRVPGEFRDGDVAIGKDDHSWRVFKYMNREYNAGRLKGFYPAESFIEFGGVDE